MNLKIFGIGLVVVAFIQAPAQESQQSDAGKSAKAVQSKDQAGGDFTILEEDEDIVVDDPVVQVPPANQKTNTEVVKPGGTDTIAKQTAAQKTSDKKDDIDIIEEDELILDEGEEYLLAPLQKKEKVVPVVENREQADLSPQGASKSNVDQAIGSSTADSSGSEIKTNPQAVLEPMKKAEPELIIPPPVVTIEEARSINFAQNLKEYRSPKLAMLMSLIIPGTGQAYAKNYLKASLFAVGEVALAGVGVYLSVLGNEKKLEARKVADNHFNADTLHQYFNELKLLYSQRLNDTLAEQNLDFLPDSTFYQSARNKTNDFYNELNRTKSYVQGWDDCEPSLGAIGAAAFADTMDGRYGRYTLSYDDGDTSFYYINKIGDQKYQEVLGYSGRMEEYFSLLGRSKRYYDGAYASMYVIILNHIVSAIDAGITTKAHNDKLLGQKSVWQRINLQQKLVNTGSETVPCYAIQIRF